MSSAFRRALDELADDEFDARYGPWQPWTIEQVVELFAGSDVHWWIAGGRAARLGAQPRHHKDVDVAIRLDTLDEARRALADWHLWEADSGALRPLLPLVELSGGVEQFWVRRAADQPWVADVLLDSSTECWTYKRDHSVTMEWDRAIVHDADGVPYLRPVLALLHKAHLDRPKDRADLAAAVLDDEDRAWLAATLARVGHTEWADLVGR